jgi:eukaryotic-like serine/threonine-protein kinase
MALDIDELGALDRLLDQALELPPHERHGWLDRLGPEFARLAPTLRYLLTRDAPDATQDVLDRPPRIGDLVAHAFCARSDAEAGSSLAPGLAIGPYRLMRELGAGGMGVVWLAERTDGLIERPVALKLPLVSLHHRGSAERFARERGILARLAHPNIARLYDAGVTVGGQPYLALEFVEGEPLTAWCDARKASVRDRIVLVTQVLRAVQYAHANLVVHRDLKPSNILVTGDGEVRLLDFGIAKLVVDGEMGETELTRVAGRALTPTYAAPEAVAGTPVSIVSDVYSVGVILYELLSGARPYRPREESGSALEDAILHVEPARPSVSVTSDAATRRGVTGARKLAAQLRGDLDTITLKTLKKRPDDRYPTAAALLDDLERHLRGDAIDARADSALYRATRVVMRHRAAFGTAALAVVALIAGASIAIWQAHQARSEAARANAVQQYVLDLFRTNSVDQPDPVRARQTTARDLLDLGRARIGQALTGQPESRLALLETLGRLYAELGLWTDAANLGEQRIALARVLYGSRDLRLADALGDQLFWLTYVDDTPPERIEAMITEALVIRDALDDTTSVGRAKLHEGASIHLANRSLAAAVDHGQRAVRIYRDHHPSDPDFPEALAALGNARQREGEWPAALATYEEALGIARALHVPDHRLRYFLECVGEISYFMGRGERADTLLREALALSERHNGSKHATTVSARTVVARNLAAMSHVEEANNIADQVIADISGDAHEVRATRDIRRVLFDVYWLRGNLGTARDLVVAALTSYGTASPDTFEHADLLNDRAAIEIVTGRHAEALATLAQASAIADRLEMSRASLLRGNLALSQAQARLAAHDARGAQRLLQEQAEYWTADHDGMAALRAELNAALVAALLAQGDVPRARQVVEQGQKELSAAELGAGQLPLAHAQLERAMGTVLMAEGAYVRALAHLQHSADLYARLQLPDSPFRGEVEALRAACLARLSRYDDVRAALALAQPARAKYGRLGDPYEQSVREAERLLHDPPLADESSPRR